MTEMTRAQFLAGLAALPVSALAAQAPAPAAPAAPPAEMRSVRVPFDHERPAEGGFALDYFLARPFRPGRDTIFVLGDGQQFYVRRDLWADWADAFGADANVVGIAGRGFAPALQQRVGSPSGDGWVEAYRLLRYAQWAGDVDAVRRSLVGAEGRILLYGASGGGRLVHEYLSVHGRHASHAMTQAAGFTYLDAEFGFRSDRFWEEIPAEDRAALTALLRRRPERRDEIAMLFQRQNFFVPPAGIGAARRRLVADLAAERSVAQLRSDYQLDAIAALMASPAGAAIRVRLYEFYAPVAERFTLDGPAFHPDLEVSAATARPLLELRRAGRLPAPRVDLAALHRLDTEMLMLAGRYDHTSDYRTQAALAASYKRRRLLILDDNHTFDRMDTIPGAGRRLRTAWRSGLDSADLAAAAAALAPIVWRET